MPEDDPADAATRAAEIAAADPSAGRDAGRDRAIYGVPIEVTVSVGKAHPMIAEIVSLRRDSEAGWTIPSRSTSAAS